MKFDNKQFEANCKESMGTLAKLKAAINDSSSGNALDGLNKAVNKVDIDNVTKAIDKIESHFSLLGIAALKVKSKIVDAFMGMAKTLATTVPSIIKNGGWDRAMNIERAKFQLEGLHVAWESIKGDIEYAVDGTAYGLDAAAKAASQLVASGVQVGDSMKAALRGISGVAAMTNAQYEDIAPIFTTVAGQSKLMTMQLRQLENRGLNAAATIADYFNGVQNGSIEASDSIKKYVNNLSEGMKVSEASIREMVTDGKINFELFSAAMDASFGEHAKDANRTFEGVTANIRAALKKIGADFATPIIEEDGPVVRALQQLRLRINDIRKALGPLNTVWTAFVKNYGKAAEVFLRKLDMSFVKNIVNGLVNIFNALLSVIRPIGYAIKDIFGSSATSTIKSFAEAFEKFTSKLVLSRSEMEDFRATVRGLLSVLSIITTVIKQILGALLSVKPETINLREIILKITGTVGNLISFVSLLLQEFNIIRPVVKGISVVFGTILGVIGLLVSKIIDLVIFINKLHLVDKAITAVTTAAKVLLTVLIGLGVAIKNLVSNTIQKIPGLLTTIKTELASIVNFLKGFSVFDKVINGFTRLAESIKNLLHPGGTASADTKDLENVITIADEAVALAGPQQLTRFEKFVDMLSKVGTKVVEVSSKVVTFIKNLDYGAIAAVAFTVALAGIGYKISQTFQAVADTFTATGKAISEVGGLIGSLKDRSIMELIFGKKEEPKKQSHILLEIAAAITAVGLSFKIISSIDTNKLKEVGTVFIGIATGIITIMGAITLFQKLLGKGEALVISSTLFAIAGSLALMTAALAVATHLDFTNIQKAGAALFQLTVVLGAMATTLAILAPKLSTGALSLVAMALSIKILIGALKKLSEAEMEASLFTKAGRNLWGKTGLLVVMAGSLVLISGIAAKLGTNSLLGILIALMTLKHIIPLAGKVAEIAKNSIFGDAWRKLVDFFTNVKQDHPKLLAGIVAFIAIGAAIAGIIGAIYLIKKAFVAIKNLSANINNTSQKFAGLQTAIARLSLVPVILALTGMFVAIGLMVGVLGKIKLPYLDQAIMIMKWIAVMFLTLAAVVAASRDSKPTAIIGAMVGISMLFSELIVLTLLVERHSTAMMIACGIMSALMLSLAAVFYNIAKASNVSGKTLVAIGMVAAIIAELGGIIYILSQQDWKGVAASGAAMTLAMLAFGKMMETIGATGQSWTKNKFLAIAECAGVVVAIGAAIALATLTHDWQAILAAGAAMSAVMVSFGYMMQIVGKTRWNAGAWSAVAAIAILAGVIGGSLALATLNHDWQAILAAAVSMSLVMAVFGGMAALLSNITSAVSVLIIMGSIAVTAVAIASSLALLVQYPWQDVLIAAGIMSGVMVIFAGIAALLGAFSAIAIPGAIALDLIAAAMLTMSIAVSALVSVLTTFLPIANQFLSGVLGTLATYGPELPSIAGGLTLLAGSLALLGATGIIVGIGAMGLLTLGAALLAIVPAGLLLQNIDYQKIAKGLFAICGPAALVGPVGLSMLVGAPGLIAAAAAIVTFAGALAVLNKVMDSKVISNLEVLPKKMVTIGMWIPMSLANGMSMASAVNTAINAAKNLAKSVESTIRNNLQIHSESPLFKLIGGWISKSIGSGITNESGSATSAAGSSMDDIIDTVKGYIPDFTNAGTDLFSGLKDGAMKIMDQLSNATGVKLIEIKRKWQAMKAYSSADFGFMGDASLPTDVRRQMQEAEIARIEREAAAAEKAADAEDDYTKATKNAGKSSKSTAEKVGDLGNAFKSVERAAKKSLSVMTDNLTDNLRAHVKWAFDIQRLTAKGYDKQIIEAAKKGGIAGHENVKALLSATEEDVPKLNDKLKKYFTIEDITAKIISGKYGELGSASAKAFMAEFEEVYDTHLAESLQNALKPFDEFNSKTEKGSDQLIKNMKSQVEGFEKWGGMINSLQHRNLNENAMKYLIDLGVEGYEDVTAIFNMTDAQIEEFNTLWEKQETLGKDIAGGINHEMNLVALGAVEGFTDGIDPNVAHETMQEFAKEGVAGAKEGFDEHSPSREMMAIALNAVLGFSKYGIEKKGYLGYQAMLAFSKKCKDKMYSILNEEAGEEIATFLLRGLKRGLENEENQKGPLSAIGGLCKKIIDKAKNIFDENSPSKVFEEIGGYLDEGMAVGINKRTGSVIASVSELGDSTIQMMNDIIKNISEDIDGSPEFQPVIRPELDLTSLQNGKSQIDGLLGNPAYQMASGIRPSTSNRGFDYSAIPNTKPTTVQNFIVNQTNNSPKNLDPYETYRQTRNALTMMKGAKT